MASQNNPASSAELIRKYSHASVATPSKKQFVTKTDPLTGLPSEFSREMNRHDAVEAMVRKYA